MKKGGDVMLIRGGCRDYQIQLSRHMARDQVTTFMSCDPSFITKNRQQT